MGWQFDQILQNIEMSIFLRAINTVFSLLNIDIFVHIERFFILS